MLVLLAVLFAAPSPARSFREAHEGAIVRQLADFVSIPNLATDAQNLERNAAYLAAQLQHRGLKVRRLQEPGAPPTVFAELRAPGAQRTVVFYAHFDGQPVDPSQWKSPPFTAVLRDKSGRDLALPAAGDRLDPEARLYARSASDDKAAIVALLAALDALKSAGTAPSVNLKFYFEGEEEADSPHLRAFLEHNRELLRGDAWIFCDSPMHQSGRPMVVYGARGVTSVELTVYGPTRALHDGHYGNWAPNPALLLASLLSSMRDADGRVLVAGFGGGVVPLSPAQEKAVRAAPSIDAELRRSLGLAHSEAGDAPLAERITQPALNVRGLFAGKVGAQAANAIPTEARASIDFRLVPDQSPERVRESVERHLAAQGYFVVRDVPDAQLRLAHPRLVRAEWRHGYAGYRAPMDLPFARAVSAVVRGAVDAPLVELPNMGGSVPLSTLHEVLGAPVLILPIVNFDNNQHAANENLRLGNLWTGIDLFAALFTQLGSEWR